MPLYEYQCQACRTQHELLQRLSDPPATRCPACGAEALVKSVSAAGFRLAGGGWYETDFKNGSKKNLSGDAGAGASGGAAGGAASEGGAASTAGGSDKAAAPAAAAPAKESSGSGTSSGPAAASPSAASSSSSTTGGT